MEQKKSTRIGSFINLEKIKTIGDAYMAAGGLHIPKISEPQDVIKAALEMQQFIIDRKAERSKLNLPAFNMRVGIHTGPVVAGIVGVKNFNMIFGEILLIQPVEWKVMEKLVK